MQNYFDVTFTPTVEAEQKRHGSFAQYAAPQRRDAPEGLGHDEIAFLGERDSFYLASTSESGWPYVQHRGGPAGFVHVLDADHIAWFERPGSRQYLTAGNLSHDNRVAIIAIDYPNRRRLKLLGFARYDREPDATVVERFGDTARQDGLVVVEVVAFSWNCPKHITPRYTAEEVRAAVQPLTDRIAALEAELAIWRGRDTATAT
jgi:hypothetical protein